MSYTLYETTKKKLLFYEIIYVTILEIGGLRIVKSSYFKQYNFY